MVYVEPPRENGDGLPSEFLSPPPERASKPHSRYGRAESERQLYEFLLSLNGTCELSSLLVEGKRATPL